MNFKLYLFILETAEIGFAKAGKFDNIITAMPQFARS